MLALKTQEVRTGQGVWAPPGARKDTRTHHKSPQNIYLSLVAQVNGPFPTSDLQSCKIIHVCCSKPESAVICHSSWRKLRPALSVKLGNSLKTGNQRCPQKLKISEGDAQGGIEAAHTCYTCPNPTAL